MSAIFLRKAVAAALQMANYRASHEPTPQQLKDNDYEKRKQPWKGMTIAIENEAGHVRRGTNRDGVTWEIRMKFAYGEILHTKGVDGDPVDCFIGPNMDDAPNVYVVHARKVNRWNQYDEDKCMLGFMSEEDAKAAFLSCYSDERFLGDVTTMPVEEFLTKVRATKEKPAMIKALLFLKSAVLVSVPVHVAASVDKHGVVREAHMSTRKVAIEQNQTKLDKFIASHGGADRLRQQMEKMTPQQRAQLISAMTHIDNISENAVLVKLGMRKPSKLVIVSKPKEEPAPEPVAEVAPAVEAEPAPEPPVEVAQVVEQVAEIVADTTTEPVVAEEHPIVEHETEKSREAVAEDGSPLADDDDPNSPNYRFRDTGYVAGSRKEMAAEQLRAAGRNRTRLRATDIDWDELESNPREAEELIKKSNLFGEVDWETLQADGMQASAGYLIDRVYAAVGTTPFEANAESRKNYALGLETLRDRMEKCKTPAEVTAVLNDIKDEINGEMLNAREAEEYQQAYALYREAAKTAHDAKQAMEMVFKQWNHSQIDLSGLEYEQSKRTRRGWKPDPELATQITELRADVDKKRADYIAYKDSHPELESKQRQLGNGYSSNDNDLEYEARLLRDKAQSIKAAAGHRNVMENPLTRGWVTLGKRFLGVVHYRSFKGSDAFQEHVTLALTGGVKDWSWAEKEKIDKPRVSKRDVSFQLKVAENYTRKGGRSITVDSTEQLKERFGIREVQSGNWVLRDVNSAKFHVQKSAEAFADLSDILGIRDSQLACNGRVALAFGARGHGNAGFGGASRAHYEPVHRVINLTKMGGGGCLAHEMFHAIDNLVKEIEGAGAAGKNEFLSEQPELLPAGDLQDAFKQLKDAIHTGPHRLTKKIAYTDRDHRVSKYNIDSPGSWNTIGRAIKNAGNAVDAILAIDKQFEGYYGSSERANKKTAKQHSQWKRLAAAYYDNNPAGGEVSLPVGPPRSSFAREAVKLDGGEPGKYWSEGCELAARAFQSYCEDKLHAQGRNNDYLSAFADNKHYQDGLFGPTFPFPEGDERTRINSAFDNLFAVMAKNGTLAKAMETLSDVQQAEAT